MSALQTALAFTSILFVLCGHVVYAEFRVYRGDEVRELEVLSDPEKLEVAAKTGESQIVELVSDSQAAVVQSGVSLSVDCLPWLNQSLENGTSDAMIRWSFIQLDKSGNMLDSSFSPAEEILNNENSRPRPRIVVGGQDNRWLNITSTLAVRAAQDPDAKIFMCEVCENLATRTRCSVSNYTQFVVGSPPFLSDTSDQRCISRDMGSTVIELECMILKGQPSPLRSWFKDGELVYSAISGLDFDASDFLSDNPLLIPGVLDPTPFTALKDGIIFYNYDIMNISVPSMLPPGTTLEQATQEVFDLLIGNWTCLVNNTLGLAMVTYTIRECERTVSFESENYTVAEDKGPVEVCIIGKDHIEMVEVVITPLTKGVNSSAADDSDFDTSNKVVYLNTSDSRTCVNITVFEDDVYEGNEQFMVTFGSFSSAQDGVGLIEQSCVTIVDDEIPEVSFISKNITVFENVTKVEVCISTRTALAANVTVTAQTELVIGSADETTAHDHRPTDILFEFKPITNATVQVVCANITIIDDMIPDEPVEVISITLVNASPIGLFHDNSIYITIYDDDNLADLPRMMDPRGIIVGVVVAVAIVVIIIIIVIITVTVLIVVKKRKKPPEPQESKGKSEDIDTPKVADSNGEPGEVIEIEKKDTSQ